MKHPLNIAALLLIAAPALSGELKLLSPADATVVKGTVPFRIQPVHDPGEQILEVPRISIQDEYAREVVKLEATPDRKTGISSVNWETARLKDGLYLVTVTYRTLKGLRPVDYREDLTLGVRNTPARAGRVVVEIEERPYPGEEACDVTVRVLDTRGRALPAARVAFKVDRGEVDTEAEISDSDGEVFATVDSEDVQDVTLTISVAGLRPVTRLIRFVQ